MTDVPASYRFRKTVAGLAMIGAPVLLLAASIVSPRLDSSERDQLGIVAANVDRWYISNLLAFVGLIVLIPAILGLMHLLRERQVLSGHLGGALAVIGTACAIGSTALSFAVWQMVAAGADRGQMASLFHRVTHTAGSAVPLYFGAFAMTAGFLVLAYGLWRAHAVHWTMAACVAVGFVAFAVAFAMFSVALLIIASAFALVGLGAIGNLVLTESAEEWEHTPEFRGFRPLAGH